MSSDFKVQLVNGDEIVVASGGKITVETGGTIETPEGVFVAVEFDTEFFEVSDGTVTLKEDVAGLLEIVAGIPTEDPESAGEVWLDGTTLKVSEGGE